MNKKRERAIFLGNRLKVSRRLILNIFGIPYNVGEYFQNFADEYHTMKMTEAAKTESLASSFMSNSSPRQLLRSNSIQEELSAAY